MTFVAVIDPNWTADAGGGGRGAQEHYDLATTQAVARAYGAHPAWMNDGPALVFMWATASAFATGDAHNLAGFLRLKVVAGFVWAKARRGRGPFADVFAPEKRMGLGGWTRCEHEHLLICKRGRVPMPPTRARQRSVIYAPRGAHSVKPDEAWAVIEATCAHVEPTRRVEFNARTKRAGWEAVGRLDGEDKPIRWER